MYILFTEEVLVVGFFFSLNTLFPKMLGGLEKCILLMGQIS